MDEIDALAPDDVLQFADIQRHSQGVFGLRRKGNPQAAARLQFADKPPALAGDQRPRARRHKRLGDIDGRALRAAGVQFGDDLKNGAPGKVGHGAEGVACRGVWGWGR